MSNWKKWLLCLALFLAGVGVGAVGSHMYDRHRLFKAFGDGHGPTPENILAHIDENVGLTADQKARILPILKEMMTKMDELTRDTRPKLDQAFKETDERIASMLDDAQKKRFTEFMDRVRRFRPGGPGGPGGPPPGGPGGPGGPPPGGPDGPPPPPPGGHP